MRNDIIVRKMVVYCEKILCYCKDKNYDSFIRDSQLVEACVFDLSQMGELANRLDEEFINAHSQLPWRELYGLRNRIVHDYDGVNLQLVWQIISEDLPHLTKLLHEITI